jgi:hypothetical protein
MVIAISDLHGDLSQEFTPTDLCFYCGEPLVGERWVMWAGNDERGTEIWLHGNCADNLSFHLTLDAAESRK